MQCIMWQIYYWVLISGLAQKVGDKNDKMKHLQMVALPSRGLFLIQMEAAAFPGKVVLLALWLFFQVSSEEGEADGKGDKVGVDDPVKKWCYQKISKDGERRK